MEPVVGIFSSRTQAERAVERLRAAGIPGDRINVLAPGASESRLHAGFPTSDSEGEGVAPALGGVVGAAAGGSAGLGLGAAVASLIVPGVGPISAIGLAAAALFGAAGAVGGVAAGEKLEEKTFQGIPRDDVYVYEDSLRRGHSVVLAIPRSERESDAARSALEDAGAESVDAARERWWNDLREGERLHARQQGHRFAEVEPVYRRGFQAALHPDARERTYADAPEHVRAGHAEVWDQEPFRCGYERGCEWSRSHSADTAGASRSS
jgi:hypothetical protein